MMLTQTSQNTQAVNQNDPTSKKAYHRPQLKKFGNVNELTKTTSPNVGNGNDGGSFPNQYNS